MPQQSAWQFKRVLEPVERISEILFGLIMVLTFTLSFSLLGADRGELRSMLMGAVGCNLAWGIIDAGFYLLGCLTERGHNILLLQRVRTAVDQTEARRVIADAMPPLLASLMSAGDFDLLRQQLLLLPEPPTRIPLRRGDGLGALAVFLLCFLSTFPVVVPFILVKNAKLALTFSNVIAIVMLFVAGYALGRHASRHPWRFGIAMIALGTAMVGIATALGG